MNTHHGEGYTPAHVCQTTGMFIIRMPIPEVLEYHVEVPTDIGTTVYTKWVIQKDLPANVLTVPIELSSKYAPYSGEQPSKYFSSVPISKSALGKYVCATKLPAYSTLFFINIYTDGKNNKTPHNIRTTDAELMLAIINETIRNVNASRKSVR